MHLSENMWEPDIWIKVVFQAQKFMVNSGMVPPTTFVLIWLDIISSLKSFSPEDIITTHNKYCQVQGSVNMPITAVPSALLALAPLMVMRRSLNAWC